MIAVEINEGRLLEIRLASPVTAEEAEAFAAQAELLSEMAGERFVIAVDASAVSVLQPEIADAIIEVMRRAAPKTERQGFLIAERAITRLQLERMIRSAAGALRRGFSEPGALAAWLGEALVPAERDRLRAFLGLAERR
jgi:hypothetical protein